MRIGFHGELQDEPEIRAAFIGCGSHAFRNIYPTFHFAPVKLVATCDMAPGKAAAFAAKFGAEKSYTDHRQMLAEGGFEAVFIVVGYDQRGRPGYPDLVVDCLEAGYHVWLEKPPAATCADIERMQRAATKAGRTVMVGMKMMFYPANEKAREIMDQPAFGRSQIVTLQYPEAIPTVEEFRQYYDEGRRVNGVVSFVDHLVHPASLLIFLLGPPQTLYYERAAGGAGLTMFTFASGAVATLALTSGSCGRGGLERTVVFGEKGNHLVVENNIRVSWFKGPLPPYGGSPNYFLGGPEETTAVWEPEFSLGQLYNKGLFLLGYYGEVNEFARAILDKRTVSKCNLEQAWQVTRILEGFCAGPGKTISLEGRR